MALTTWFMTYNHLNRVSLAKLLAVTLNGTHF